MEVPGLDLRSIPPTRKVNARTELHQFLLADKASFETAKTKWVRAVAPRALKMALDAGNPTTYSTEIDGQTNAAGDARSGQGFRAGPIEAATSSVRVRFIGKPLATIANQLRPMLEKTIGEVFPTARGHLQRSFVWWASETSAQGAPVRKLGFVIPEEAITIYSVLWLVPEGSAKDTPAYYAWWANQMVKRSGARFNLLIRKNRSPRTRKRPRGYLAEATTQMRSRVGKYAGVTVQGWFVKKRFTGPNTPARFGVPVVRVAFRAQLVTGVDA
jgi:hypothetical protein